MAIDRRALFGAVLLAPALFGAATARAAPPVVAPDVERAVVAPDGTAFAPSAFDEEGAVDRFAAYVMALAKRDYAAAYAMFRLSFQAANPRLEWEMNQRKRSALWADGTLRILRLSWYPDPAGQPAGLYAAFDFRGDRKDGTMDCGYVVVHHAPSAPAWTVVRTDTSEVPADLIEDGVPKVDVLRQLPCYLGKGIATAL
ncbi:MAG: hypothetical protein DI569_06550 [Sphingopyxis macrogoltabida]|uniref:Uncharacterized protein n=1 Tax=Sphingopyxis macrogoltabida TaxID=33050 RepID=A0A2W5L132_SPHMC|nr:MAG: hypothetical protein DI569_06550 [Sphingopyxis macrogoltabida]